MAIRPKTKAYLDNIVDTIACGDGGAKLVMFMSALTQLDKQAENGDESAKIILKTVQQFSKLIDILAYGE